MRKFILNATLAVASVLPAAVVTTSVVAPVPVHAEARVIDGSNKTIYFDTKGTKLTPLQANNKGQNNEPVLACKLQDYECNERTGKCALKNAK